jgi:serine/threonine protein kinase
MTAVTVSPIAVVLGILVLVWLPVWVATLVWVWSDARRCGKSVILALLAVLLIGLVLWPIGLLAWLILRQDWLPKAVPPASPPPMQGRCPRCGQPLATGAVQGLCPACLLWQAAQDSVPPGPGLAGFTPPSPQELAGLFPQFEILELLGRGGMGAVYKARQKSLDRVVALKILPAEAGADPAFAERFQREARALAQLSHPHIVGVHDFGQAGKFAYFVMEYMDGVNLRQLERAGRLSPREALAIVPQICEALQFAHDRGVVHRDIKPENILVDAQGRVKIADFGLAKLMRPKAGEADLTLTRDAMGTPQYMAPEQIEKPEHVDHRADIYSLGVVFYEMLTGELPLGRFPAPSQRVQVDVRLDEVVLKALEKEPDRRYQQASAFKTNVETVAGTPPPVAGRDEPPARPPVVPLPPAKQKKSRWWIWLLALLVLPILIGIALPVWFLTSNTGRPAPAPADNALVLNLEMRNTITSKKNVLMQVNLAYGMQASINTSDGPSGYQYRTTASVRPDRDGSYLLDLAVRRIAPDGNADSVAIRKPVPAGVPYRVGEMQEDEFFVTLIPAGEPAASPVTQTMGLKPVWWVLWAIGAAGLVWAVVSGMRNGRPGTAAPPAIAPAEADDAADDPRAGWLRRHFRRHERRSPGEFLWRVTLEGVLVCAAVALVAALLGVEGQNVKPSELAAFAFSAVFIAPWLETLLFQMLPVGVARLCGAERRGQMIASIVLFALPHFFIAAATGLVGLAGGFYLAFSYTHWRRHSRARAYWMTVAQHALHNTAAIIVVIVLSAPA